MIMNKLLNKNITKKYILMSQTKMLGHQQAKWSTYQLRYFAKTSSSLLHEKQFYKMNQEIKKFLLLHQTWTGKFGPKCLAFHGNMIKILNNSFIGFQPFCVLLITASDLSMLHSQTMTLLKKRNQHGFNWSRQPLIQEPSFWTLYPLEMIFDVNKPLNRSLQGIRNLLIVKKSLETTCLKLYKKKMNLISYLMMQHGRNVDLFNQKLLAVNLLLSINRLPRNLIIKERIRIIRILTVTKNRETSSMVDNKTARVLLRFYTWQLGGRLKRFKDQWVKVLGHCWATDLITTGYIPEWASTPLLQVTPISRRIYNSHDLFIHGTEIKKLLEMDVIQQMDPIEPCFVSNLFLILKKSGDLRPVIDLRNLNQYIQYAHFKMEGIELVKSLV